MAVQPPSGPAGMRRACQNSFSPNISDSIDNPLVTNRAARQRQKIKFEYPDFISISLSSSSLENPPAGDAASISDQSSISISCHEPISRGSLEIAKPGACYRSAECRMHISRTPTISGYILFVA
jgi:hypothetical protein